MSTVSVSNSGVLCVPWSDRSKSFYILVQGPQDNSLDAWLYYYSYDLIWTRRWSFVGPLMAGIFLVVGLLIPGILFVIMVKWLRPRYLDRSRTMPARAQLDRRSVLRAAAVVRPVPAALRGGPAIVRSVPAVLRGRPAIVLGAAGVPSHEQPAQVLSGARQPREPLTT